MWRNDDAGRAGTPKPGNDEAPTAGTVRGLGDQERTTSPQYAAPGSGTATPTSENRISATPLTSQRGPHAALADQVMARIRGQQDAQRVLHAIRQGCAPEDALFDAVRAVQAIGDAERVRGFLREVQKRLEAAERG